MKKLVLIIILIAVGTSFAQIEPPFLGFYWILGEVKDASGASANGRRIYFSNQLASDTIGVPGNSGQPNRFLINAITAGVPLNYGAKYQVFTDRVGGVGAGPYEVTITGKGYEEVGPFQLTAGGGVSDIRSIVTVKAEGTPSFKSWFGSRKYQKELAEKEEFIVPNKPKIRVEVEVNPSFQLDQDPSSYQITIDEGLASSRTYRLTEFSAGKNKVTGEIIWPDKLGPGQHTFKFRAKSFDEKNIPIEATEITRVTVLGGPLRVVGLPIAYPSPYDLRGEVTFQYTLSEDANIDLFIFNISAQIIKKFSFAKGRDGGVGQLNSVKWDGRDENGTAVPNGIYIVNIVAHDDLKVLQKLKLVVFRQNP